MKTALICISFVLVVSQLHFGANAFDFCYRANVSNNQATNGNASSRETEVENAVRDMLNELGNDTNLDFTTSARNQTLEAVEGDGSMTVFRVLICLTNSSKTQAEFTQILVDFTFQTQIDNVAVTAGDYDECNGNFTTTCHELASCNNSNGSFACICPDEYFDRSTNNATGQDCVLPTNHTCGSGEVEVSAYLPYFTALGINETELRVGECNGTVMGENLVFSGVCSPSVQDNDTHIIYTWNLTNIDPNADVTIGNYAHIPLVCASVANGTVNITFNGSEAEPIPFGENLFINLGDEAFQIQVQAFSDLGFLNAFSEGGTIKTNQDLAFRMGPVDGFISTNIKTVCQGLTTGPAEGFTEPSSLIRDGCKVTDSSLEAVLNTVNIIEQGTSSEARVSLQAHFFTNSLLTQLSFEVYTCLESGGGSSCQPSCNSRRRRSIYNVRMRRQSRSGSGVGYFVFARDSTDECTRDCGSGICILDPLRQQQCACSQEYTYKDETGKCMPIEDLNQFIPKQVEDLPILLIVLIAVIAVLFVGLAIVLIIFVFHRKRNPQSIKISH